VKQILDTIHGHIKIDNITKELIDTNEFQRLRNIKQLGFANFVYPGANHTRFEHSIGVMHISEQMANNIKLDQDQTKSIKCAALLHDINHGPFSHTSEHIIKKHTGKSHENVLDKIHQSEIYNILTDNGIDAKTIEEHIHGKHDISQILSSEIDADKMDYLARDSHYTGIVAGTFDYQYLIQHMELKDHHLIVDDRALKTAEQLLMARFWMNISVYYHHASKIADAMCIRGIDEMIKTNYIHPDEITNMVDMELILSMQQGPSNTKQIANRLINRNLFKRAFESSHNNINQSIDCVSNHKTKLENEIAYEADIDPFNIIIDDSTYKNVKEMKALIETEDGYLPLNEASQVVKSMTDVHDKSSKLSIYCPDEYKSKVNSIACNIFK
jgi:hypothetical protein